ncbi:MAG TPA: EF-hand domain-containing protein [Dongiaceae bacterium]|jgi:Ca2+-binding EF-hand superfamily protein|nr:EF-hand domain-containing protein [Dongiaceae bacterium]
MNTSSIGFGGGASMMRSLQQQLFSQIDGNADGSISKTEMESAVTDAGGTTEEADALFAKLDSGGTGSINGQQFASGLKSSLLGDGMISQLIGIQEVSGPSGGGAGGPPSFISDLFSTIDADGDGSITKGELEDAVANAGGTAEEADALYGKLDPDDTGSVTEEQFAAAMMPPPPPPPATSEADASDSEASSASATDSNSDAATTALQLLLEAMEDAQQKQDDSSSTNAASSAFQDLLNSLGTSSDDATGAAANANLAASAMQELVQHYVQALSSASAATTSTVSTTA